MIQMVENPLNSSIIKTDSSINDHEESVSENMSSNA